MLGRLLCALGLVALCAGCGSRVAVVPEQKVAERFADSAAESVAAHRERDADTTGFVYWSYPNVADSSMWVAVHEPPCIECKLDSLLSEVRALRDSLRGPR